MKTRNFLNSYEPTQDELLSSPIVSVKQIRSEFKDETKNLSDKELSDLIFEFDNIAKLIFKYSLVLKNNN